MPRLSRSLSTVLLVCGLAIPVLAGCEAGLNAPTLDFHPAANGATTTSPNGITINNAFVLGPGIGQSLPAGSQAGLFLSMYATSADRLESVSASGAAGSVKIQGGSVNLSPGTPANLTGPAPRIVLTNLSAPLQGGQSVTLNLTFANAGNVQILVPVEPQAYDYATYAQPSSPAPSPTATATTSASATASGTQSATTKAKKTKAKAKPSTSASPSPTP